MTKFYLANTPLILTDDNGTDYRVERGEVAELSDAQYEQVAAHVTPVGTPELMQPETQPESKTKRWQMQTATLRRSLKKPNAARATKPSKPPCISTPMI